MSEVVVYSVIVGGYDVLLPPRVRDPGVRYVLLTDRRPRLTWGWEIRPLPAEAAGLPPTLANRWCKLFPHLIFPEARFSVYMDGNIRQIGFLEPLMDEFREGRSDFGTFSHVSRATIFEEIEACRAMGKFDAADLRLISAQVDRYVASGLPDDHVLTENAVLIRRHATPILHEAMSLWWGELEHGAKRDQISLPWVRHVTGIATKIWEWNYREPNPYFKIAGAHRQPKSFLNEISFLIYVLREDNRYLNFFQELKDMLKGSRHRPI